MNFPVIIVVIGIGLLLASTFTKCPVWLGAVVIGVGVLVGMLK